MITRKYAQGNYFHGVLCLSEVKGMDIKMKKVKIICSIIAAGIFILALSVCFCFVRQSSREADRNTETTAGNISGGNREPEKGSLSAQSPVDAESEIHEDEEEGAWVFEHWTDFKNNYDLPYADEEVVAILREAYGKVNFRGTFEQGDLGCYDEYKGYFLKLVENEMPFTDMETGDIYYIKDFKGLEDIELYRDSPVPGNRCWYYFFDMDEDGAPELGIRNPNFNNYNVVYIFRYDEEKEECFLWYTMDSSWYSLFGSRKVAWLWDGKYLAFYQLDANGDVELETFGISNWYSDEISLHMVMVPNYREEEKKIEVTDIMKEQGILERFSGCWFFRVTDEQYEELMKPLWDADYLAEKERQEVTYSHEELFGDIQYQPNDVSEGESWSD